MTISAMTAEAAIAEAESRGIAGELQAKAALQTSAAFNALSESATIILTIAERKSLLLPEKELETIMHNAEARGLILVDMTETDIRKRRLSVRKAKRLIKKDALPKLDAVDAQAQQEIQELIARSQLDAWKWAIAELRDVKELMSRKVKVDKHMP